MKDYRYIIVGAGLAGATASAGIREHDRDGSVLLIGNEPYLPYHRPPLTKDLWFGKKALKQVYFEPESFYADNRIELALGVEVTGLDADNHLITDSGGVQHHFDKLLLATGGIPRLLNIPGGNLDGVCYYRFLDDYQHIRDQAAPGKTAVVIGGGFIGSEIAAGLAANQVKVTMIFPEPYLVERIFPAGLGQALQEQYRRRGITILAGDSPEAIEKQGEQFVTRTKAGQQCVADMLLVGVGIVPAVELAQLARLKTDNGILVNEYLQTSHPDIYAAGDNANFPYSALGQHMRVEHWDNALNQGKYAGRNMAGARAQYDYMPYFFSDLFEFGYEAVGEVSTKLETFADWQQENETGVIYYLRDGKVRGAMMCNMWNQVNAARELIAAGRTMTREQLRGAIGKPGSQSKAA